MNLLWTVGLSLVIALAVGIAVSFKVNSLSNGYKYNYITMIVLVSSFMISFHLMTKRIIRDFTAISQGIERMAEGGLSVRISMDREDELGRVASGINAMAQRLEAQISKERQLEQSKMELITGISHDLRTPLTSIIGYVDLLRSRSYRDADEQQRFIDNTYSKAVYLKSLIDDLFEYTRLSGGAVPLRLQKVSIRDLLEQMAFEFEPIAKENRVELASSLGQAEASATIDIEKFVRAVENLLMNALKFSLKPGTIRIRLKEEDGFISVIVENRGEPITEEQEKHLFDRFYKADDSRSTPRIQAGAGLGLSIARSIAQQHGGDIALKHQRGFFAFELRLPRGKDPRFKTL